LVTGSSTNHALVEFEIREVNEVLYSYVMGLYISGNDSNFDDHYTQSVTPGTQTTSDSDSVSNSAEGRTVIHDQQGIGLRGVSMKFGKMSACYLQYMKHSVAFC
jgi:hypothetical protein